MVGAAGGRITRKHGVRSAALRLLIGSLFSAGLRQQGSYERQAETDGLLVSARKLHHVSWVGGVWWDLKCLWVRGGVLVVMATQKHHIIDWYT